MFGWFTDRTPVTRGEFRKAMADITKLKADLQNLVAQEAAAETKTAADLATIKAAIQALKDQIAAGGSVSQSDLDALDAQVTQVGTGLGNIVSGLDAEAAADAPPTPPAPPAGS